MFKIFSRLCKTWRPWKNKNAMLKPVIGIPCQVPYYNNSDCECAKFVQVIWKISRAYTIMTNVWPITLAESCTLVLLIWGSFFFFLTEKETDLLLDFSNHNKSPKYVKKKLSERKSRKNNFLNSSRSILIIKQISEKDWKSWVNSVPNIAKSLKKVVG